MLARVFEQAEFQGLSRSASSYSLAGLEAEILALPSLVATCKMLGDFHLLESLSPLTLRTAFSPHPT
jgi:hypothetical protein